MSSCRRIQYQSFGEAQRLPLTAQNPFCRRYGLLKLCVLRFLQDGNVGVGVFPQRQEILIRALCFGGVAL